MRLTKYLFSLIFNNPVTSQVEFKRRYDEEEEKSLLPCGVSGGKGNFSRLPGWLVWRQNNILKQILCEKFVAFLLHWSWTYLTRRQRMTKKRWISLKQRWKITSKTFMFRSRARLSFSFFTLSFLFLCMKTADVKLRAFRLPLSHVLRLSRAFLRFSCGGN